MPVCVKTLGIGIESTLVEINGANHILWIMSLLANEATLRI